MIDEIIGVVKVTKEGQKAVGKELEHQEGLLNVYYRYIEGSRCRFWWEHKEYGKSEKKHGEVVRFQQQLLFDFCDSPRNCSRYMHSTFMEMIRDYSYLCIC